MEDIVGQERTQSTLFPLSLEEYVRGGRLGREPGTLYGRLCCGVRPRGAGLYKGSRPGDRSARGHSRRFAAALYLRLSQPRALFAAVGARGAAEWGREVAERQVDPRFQNYR